MNVTANAALKAFNDKSDIRYYHSEKLKMLIFGFNQGVQFVLRGNQEIIYSIIK